MSRNISGVLLAAGSSARFGSNKLLHLLPDGTPIGLAAARKLVEVLPDSLAVVRNAGDEAAELFAGAGLQLVVNAGADDGMGGSLACGVQARSASGGWVIALADMPWISTTSIEQVVRGLERGAEIVAPRYGQQRGHPVGFCARYFPDLTCLRGDEGARRLLVDNASRLTLLDVDDPGV